MIKEQKSLYISYFTAFLPPDPTSKSIIKNKGGLSNFTPITDSKLRKKVFNSYWTQVNAELVSESSKAAKKDDETVCGEKETVEFGEDDV
jgi:hypothetical protein